MAQSPTLPTWVGELYLETHRGTYTTQSRTKRANRKSELLLYEAEAAASLANLQGGAISTATLKKAWERVLLQQFHDILPGSSIGQVYADNLADHDLAQTAALEVRQDALRWQAERQIAAGQVGVFNPFSWSRSDPLQAAVPDPGTPFHLLDSKGRTCPIQLLSSGHGQAHILFEPYEVPALGWEAFSIQAGQAPAVQLLRAWERGLENAMFRLEVDDEGQVVRLLDKRCGREVIPAGQAAKRLAALPGWPRTRGRLERPRHFREAALCLRGASHDSDHRKWAGARHTADRAALPPIAASACASNSISIRRALILSLTWTGKNVRPCSR